MPTPEEIEAAAGIAPGGEDDRKRIWAAAQAHAAPENRGPAADDLRIAAAMLEAAGAIGSEHLAAGLGRAVITLTDSETGDEEVDVAVEFSPQLEEVSAEEVAGTPAQLLALEVLEGAFGDAEEHDHDHE
ncbi:MAG: hypothetical protein QOI80_2444 [Solirubrobacteraceae bacterium]|jgi:hypothetical protein|nr:hypothetical protein [Solirubrobacteraceae bacterium]